MPDWKMLVQQRLGVLGSDSEGRDETVSELACHLEDVYEAQRAKGLSESEAIELALEELAGGRRLGRKIQNSKEGKMNERTRKFWLPALASVTAACILVAVVSQLSYVPRVVLLRSGTMMLVYPIWLLGQLFPGAVGAYFSRRAGGNRLTRLMTGLFPAIAMLAVISIVVLVQALTQGRHDFGRVDGAMIARAMVSVVLLPAVALLLGILPFLRDPARAS
jgi:hypothetical protein